MSVAYDLRERTAAVDEFTLQWYAFVDTWSRARRRNHERAARLVESALQQGLPAATQAGRLPTESAEVACARAVVARSGLFDAEGYVEANRLTLRRGEDPLTHFCRDGWRELRAPSLDFDLWWYWTEHLDPTREAVNPVVHHALEGRRHGLATVPPPPPAREPGKVTPPVRRICLYAAYDRDGLVDPYVVDYLTELSRFADVYYLADGVLDPGELDKLAAVTKGAWSIPHAAYDFGSFSMLARDLVGWDVIDGYDELLLANDSCFLVRPLDEVFARMDARACDWWSLQATSMEHQESYTRDDSPIPLAEAKRRFIGPRQWSDVHYLHLSSYFMSFRSAVHRDPGFRWRLDTVSGQRDKHMVIHKYEVGISRYLMDSGFDFDTFIGDLYAFHPLYSRHFFELVEKGFPLVKRNFLAENPKHVLGLEEWPARLRDLVPDAPVEQMKANIERVSPADRLAAAYDVRVTPTGHPLPPERPLTGYPLRVRDRETASHGHWWAFPVSAASHRLDPGARAVLEEVRDDPSIHKVILTRSRRVDLPGANLTSVPLASREGQEALIRSGRIFVDDQPGVPLPLPLSPRRHAFVHLGLGLPFVAARMDGGAEATWRKLRGLVVSSEAEALVRAATSPDLGLEQMWVTGLPRHDLVVRDHADLPADVAAEEERLVERLDGRRLLLWWFDGPLTGGSDLDWLGDWCRANDVVLGVREARVDSRAGLTRAFASLGAIGLSDRHLAMPTVAHRVASLVVTDGAPAAFDALVAGTPVVHLVDGWASGTAAEWPRELWPPSLSRTTPDRLRETLETGLAASVCDVTVPGQHLVDGHSAWRLVQRVRGLSVGDLGGQVPSVPVSHSSMGR